MARKHNVNNRRISALARLEESKFTPKVLKSTGKERTEEKWSEKRDHDIKVLKSRIV